jgi:hypothetical protein
MLSISSIGQNLKVIVKWGLFMDLKSGPNCSEIYAVPTTEPTRKCY